MAVRVQQLLHGYRSGHGEISASLRLPNRDSDLVTRLSDLSGSLSSGLQLDSYLTVYPLPSREFFAVARTWADPDAPRAGCVLTHTLLFPVDVWVAYKNVRSVSSLFRNPRSAPDHDFTEAIALAPRSAAGPQMDLDVDPSASRHFVSRYFGKGIRPIVWFQTDQPDEILWRLLEHLWPRLRAVFSCCTFSLQQRTLEEGPFDLLFAPFAVYSRFTKLSPEHLIEPGAARKNPPSEPWSDYWAKTLFAPGRGLPMAENELQVWNELGEDPTAVSKLFLIQELRQRAPQSPTAGVGAIDVVESLAYEAVSAVELKRVVLAEAIQAASTAAPDEALMTLRLIEDRLRRDSFRMVSEDLTSRLAAAAAHATARDPEAALKCGAPWLADYVAGANSAFARGVIEGLRDLAARNPSTLGVLRTHPDIAAEIFRLEPTFAATYLQVGGAEAPRILAEWLSSTRDFETLRLVRKSVLPLLEEQQNEQLLPPLLRDLRAEDVNETLAVLFGVTKGFADPNVQTVVGDHVSHAYPDAVRSWASRSAAWSPGLARVIALSYPQNRQGFHDLLDNQNLDGQKKAEVVASAIRCQSSYGHPYWLREIVSGDVRLMRILLLSGPDTLDVAESVLPLLLNEAELPLAKDDDVLEAVLSFSGRPIFSQLIDAGMRSLIKCYLVEGRGSEAMRRFEESPEASGWLQSVPASRLTDFVVKACYSGQFAVARAWMWIAHAPRSLYERRSSVLPDLCDALLRFSHESFPQAMEDSFLHVLRRSTSEAGADVRQSLAAKMLRFGFDHVSFPLGGVVAETFADAYAAALEEDHRSSSIFTVLFGSYNWDRAKDLRVSLIDAFLRSNWLPADLAIAANKAGILRKTFKRLHRRYGGDNYLQRMVQDLRGRNDPRLIPVREQLDSMSNAPNFYEEWD
jgi:hypothetical protein